jgi:hypothetical protein
MITKSKKEYFLDDPLTRCISNQNQMSVPGASLLSISQNLIKSQVRAKNHENHVVNKEDKNNKKEIKAFLELDTKRFQYAKNDCESLDSKFSKRFAAFQNIENALR